MIAVQGKPHYVSIDEVDSREMVEWKSNNEPFTTQMR
jgi:hypothetical protein